MTTAFSDRAPSKTPGAPDTARYAKCIEVSKRVRWDIEHDVIRGRRFDFQRAFLPEGLTRSAQLGFLDAGQRRLFSQVQGRTYANMFGLVERFIGAKMLELSRRHWFGDQVALEALVRFADEELKHQALFHRIERMLAAAMPPGYRFDAEPNAVARHVLASSTWSVLALTCHIELFTQVHYRHSIEPGNDLCALFKDVFLYHWREESQHAILDELEWQRENARMDAPERDAAVDDFIALVLAVDGIVCAQAAADARYFTDLCKADAARGGFDAAQQQRIEDALRSAYRWQYIVSGAQDARFAGVLRGMLDDGQVARIGAAIDALVA